MANTNYFPEVLETTEPELVASGFKFLERPTWHPDDYWWFVAPLENKLLRLTLGKPPKVELVRMTEGGIGTTLDLQGRLILCEARGRRLTRTDANGKVETLVDRYRDGRLTFPDDACCHSNGCIYFTDPDKLRPFSEREIPGPAGDSDYEVHPKMWDGSRVYRVTPDGDISVLAFCEHPNGPALSPDERILYVCNTRTSKYIHALRLDADGRMVGRSIFADMNEGTEPGIPTASRWTASAASFAAERAASGCFHPRASGSA